MTLSNSRQQFLAYDTREPENIQYGRRGGFFITKCICFLFVLLAILVAVIVGITMYYICRHKLTQENNDLWSDSDPMSSASVITKNLRLPNTVIPSYYRLKLIPKLNESSFSGEMYITLKTNAHNIKKIILHSKGLKINNNIILTEQIYERHALNGRSRRQTPDNLVTNSSATVSPDDSNATIPAIIETPSQPATETVASNITETHVNNIRSNATNVPKESKNETESATVPDKPISNEINNNVTPIPTGKTTAENPSVEISNPIIPTQAEAKQTQVTHSNTRNIKVTSIEKDVSTDHLILNLETPLKPGMDYILQIAFDGNITESLTGFYKSSYIDTDKKTKLLAVTQFEPTSARAAFPCFDEPEFKAMFEISIAHTSNYTVLSNMAVSSEEPISDMPGWSWTHFERSVKMSTYLVAYAISDFKHLETSYLSNDNTTKRIRVWAQPSLIENAQYAIKIVPKILTFYEKLFGIPYVLNKIDLIAVPDFSSGAMENWGLVTFRETTLLYDENEKVPRDKQNVAVDICHELAHQWFGNLVTMKWWSDLWLNEGFATYVEYVGVNHIEPEWGILDTFTKDKMELLRSDALKHTSPVSRVVNDASEIAQKFDEISYSKGASLIRMLNHTITEPLFHRGLEHYLRKWNFSNAEENDLWSAMSEATKSEQSLSNVSVINFMNTWTKQAGYPVVSVNRDYLSGDVIFQQALFTSMEKPYESMSSQVWSVPISYAAIGSSPEDWQTTPKIWLNHKAATVNLPINSSQALYVNVGSIGYYRVNYDVKNWQLLNAALNTPGNTIPSLTRAQLLDDAFNLAKFSKLEYKCALDLTTYLLQGEDSRIVWEMVLSNLAFLKFSLRTSSFYEYFQDYILRILNKELEKRNYGLSPPRSDDEAFLIENLLIWECLAESQRCLNWSKAEFNKWMSQPDPTDNPIPSYLRGLVYSMALKFGGRTEFDFLWAVFQNSTDPNVKSIVVSTLASTRDEALVSLLLERSLTEMPSQYSSSAWSFSTVSGSTIAQEFFVKNWDRIYDKFSKLDPFVFAGVISGAYGYMTTQREVDELKEFVSCHQEALKPHIYSIRKLVDSATVRINWIKLHQPAIESWLKDFKNNQTKGTEATSPRTNYGNETAKTSVDPSIPTPVPVTNLTGTEPETASSPAVGSNATSVSNVVTNATVPSEVHTSPEPVTEPK